MDDLLPNKKDINQTNTYWHKKISFTNFIKLCDDNCLLIPEEQGGLNEDAVMDLVNDYLTDKAYFFCRNGLVIGVLDTNKEYKYYIVDGQHRISMARKLNEKYDEDNSFNVSFKYCKDRKELKLLFDKMNMDSQKNNYLLKLANNQNDLLKEIKEKLNSDYKMYFSKSASGQNKIFTIDEFIKELSKEKKFIEQYDCAEDFLKLLINKNKKFNKKINEIGYVQLKENDEDQFYQDELKILKSTTYYTFAFKNNNFITDEKYLFEKNVKPEHHTFKKAKGITETALRKKVWSHEFGNNKKGDCPVLFCDNEISESNFIAGHIISETNGGERILSNLRPMCMGCSGKMYKTNWKDYENKLKQNKKEKILDSDSGSEDDSSEDSNDHPKSNTNKRELKEVKLIKKN